MIVKNNRLHAKPFYYMSGKFRKAIRIIGGKTVKLIDYTSESNFSKKDLQEGAFTIIQEEIQEEKIEEVEKKEPKGVFTIIQEEKKEKVKKKEIKKSSTSKKSKMKIAKEDVESYINKETN